MPASRHEPRVRCAGIGLGLGLGLGLENEGIPQAEHSSRKIARDTVARYLAVADEMKLARDREPTEAEVHEVAQRVASVVCANVGHTNW